MIEAALVCLFIAVAGLRSAMDSPPYYMPGYGTLAAVIGFIGFGIAAIV
jgi:hypothetical protein